MTYPDLGQYTVSLNAMPAEECAQGGARLSILWGIENSLFGPILLARTTKGICALCFIASPEEAQAWLALQWPNAKLNHLSTEYFTAHPPHTPGPLALYVQGSPFQLRVWRALLTIPYGTVTHYQHIANAIGQPRAVRAVGNAIGANPIACLIPCHRVVRSHGELGGYRWGVQYKRQLIDWESQQRQSVSIDTRHQINTYHVQPEQSVSTAGRPKNNRALRS